ncbi:hypothetical protein SAMN03159343_0241 [Klenkia marina]|uniref:Uncharacterized protein n=1 Tax=Klenkia marina TaxID=1960309 RepID=A0A1G4X9R7_9ACTN|nr:hypothetical protein [Klenkia marina]SCX37927.1 hypothetical protein SAMN03159343_0241 [Klenkia marina]
MTDSVHFLRDDHGGPLGVVSVNAVNERGAILAFAAAVASNRPRDLEQLTQELVEEVGPREAGYVFAAALGTLVQDVLDPLLDVVEATGHPVRTKLAQTLQGMKAGR